MSTTIEDFFGVYLLYCLNPKYKGRIYIGYTVNPNRRIKQHNTGKDAGGAYRTNKRGPWTMVLIIHGFPNSIAALRFEWAWQHPHRSRRLNTIQGKRSKESSYDYHLRLLSEMLNVGPWNRLPLTIRWLNEEFQRDFPVDKCPPIHMPISYGEVITKKVTSTNHERCSSKSINVDSLICQLCFKYIENKGMTCLNSNCDLISHVICLGEHYLDNGEYVPIEGKCPKCKENFLWGDVVRKHKGCNDLNIIMNTETDALNGSDSE